MGVIEATYIPGLTLLGVPEDIASGATLLYRGTRCSRSRNGTMRAAPGTGSPSGASSALIRVRSAPDRHPGRVTTRVAYRIEHR